MSKSIFDESWSILESSPGRSITISAGLDDLCEIYSSDTATVDTSRYEALRAAQLIAAAPELASLLEQLVDIVTTDRDFAKGYASQIAAAEKALSKAYGAAL